MRLSEHQQERFKVDGFVAPLNALSSVVATELLKEVNTYLAASEAKYETFDLADPIVIEEIADQAGARRLVYADEPNMKPQTFPFFFNIWRHNELFREVALDSGLGAIAKQLLGAESVLLMEDNIIVKEPRSGPVPFHQDYSYWPLESPTAVTLWIGLSDMDSSMGSMQVAPGTQRFGNRLPVAFGTGESLMAEYWPDTPEIPSDPTDFGYELYSYDISAGQGGFHDAMVWHGSTPNETDVRRVAYVIRYVEEGSIWQGGVRMPYDDVGCEPGMPLTTDHFPRVT